MVLANGILQPPNLVAEFGGARKILARYGFLQFVAEHPEA
jgi:hypothetical protein